MKLVFYGQSASEDWEKQETNQLQERAWESKNWPCFPPSSYQLCFLNPEQMTSFCLGFLLFEMKLLPVLIRME